MTNHTCEQAGTIPAYLETAKRYLFNMTPGQGPGAELLLLIVIGGLLLCL